MINHKKNFIVVAVCRRKKKILKFRRIMLVVFVVVVGVADGQITYKWDIKVKLQMWLWFFLYAKPPPTEVLGLSFKDQVMFYRRLVLMLATDLDFGKPNNYINPKYHLTCLLDIFKFFEG